MSSSSSSSVIHIPPAPVTQEEIHTALYEAFMDPTRSRPTPSQLWDRVKAIPGFVQRYHLRYAQVQHFVKNLREYVQGKQPAGRSRKVSFPIQAPQGPFSKLMIDLMDLREFPIPQCHFLLVILDVATRFVAAAFCKTKSEQELIPKMEDCFRQIKQVNGYLPSTFRLMGDKESAWEKGRQAKVFFAKNEIHTYFVDHDKYLTGVVERFIRSFREKLKQYQALHQGKIDWKIVMIHLLKEYNFHLKHTKLYQTPIQAIDRGPHLKEIARTQKRLKLAQQFHTRAGYKSNYKVGDLVRVELKPDNAFGVKGGRKFSQGTHAILEKRGNRYKIQGFPTQMFSTSELIPQVTLAPQVIRRPVQYTVVNTEEVIPKSFKRIQSQFKREGIGSLSTTEPSSLPTRKRKQVDHGVFLH